MPRTSDKAQLIMDYVNQFIQENGYSPSVREIGAAVGLRSTASVSYHLQALQEKGLLQSPGAKGRKRALVTGARPGQIPIVGVVTAGVPILAVENQEGTMPWNDPGCFALRVRGDSMINAGILSGDKVVVRPSPPPTTGRSWLPGSRTRPRSSVCAAGTARSGSCRKMTITALSTAPTRRSSASSRPWYGSIEEKVRATRKKVLDKRTQMMYKWHNIN